jgi:hypothetical protein
MPSKIETWLASLPDEAVDAELADLEAQVEALQREIAVRREVLEMKRRWQGAPAAGTNNRHAPAPPGRRLADEEELPAHEERPGRMRGKEAVLAVMRDKPESVWTLDALAEAMIARGWMDRTEDDRHALQVACSRMYRRKELRRMRPGVYRLHPRMRDISA